MGSGDKFNYAAFSSTKPEAGDFLHLPAREQGATPESAPGAPTPAPPSSPPPRPSLPRDVPQRAGIMRIRAPRPARLLRLSSCHSPRRGGE